MLRRKLKNVNYLFPMRLKLILVHMKNIFCLFFILSMVFGYAQDSLKLKTFTASRITTAPKIDGLLEDEAWKNAASASDFIQSLPFEGKPVSQKTEVRILYDDYFIYVGAMMYDSAPDSILHELGNRDDGDLNAERFRFVIDPYNTRQDAYDFGVYSSGVQLDSRFSDPTYNGVWQSSVKIINNGWSVEMKIPYSAIRFPSKKDQHWGLQFTRHIRRNREFDQWALTPAGKANGPKYWGTLEGISDIKPPLRLSSTPYLSSYLESAPQYDADDNLSYGNSFSYNAGADIKYGLDERFTLDMTLLPDFGQVQSDNKVKNLSYREVTYDDYRPFFKEGTDLFNKNRLFYSRRIGKTPTCFSSVEDSLEQGETLEKNPSQTKLLNATKVSGRGNGGLGFGLFNAVTNNTYAEVKDSLGNTRKILTEPLTNYNVLVFDQQLKNASNIYFINTDVMRTGNTYRDANVTGTGFTFQDKSNTWAIDGVGNLSQVFRKNDTDINTFSDQLGYYYFAGTRKISGTWQYGIGHETMNKTFDRSDMGFQSINNYSATNVYFSYNRFKPWGSVLNSFNSINVNYATNYTTGKRTDLSTNLNLFVLFQSYLSIFGGGGMSPVSSYDYYEPRVDGRFFRSIQYYYAYAGFSSDYKKKLALDMTVNTSNWLKNNIYNFPLQQGINTDIKPRFRVSDHLSFIYAFTYNFDPFNVGYADTIKTTVVEPIFGGRILNTYINTLTAKYIFKNDLSLSLNARHYWSTGEYVKYFHLSKEGELVHNVTYTGNNNFSYNAFNIDAVFSWQFSPGSVFSVVYKNAIEESDDIIPVSFKGNFSNTLQSPQTNSISLKVLYFLDYQQLKRKKVHA